MLCIFIRNGFHCSVMFNAQSADVWHTEDAIKYLHK